MESFQGPRKTVINITSPILLRSGIHSSDLRNPYNKTLKINDSKESRKRISKHLRTNLLKFHKKIAYPLTPYQPLCFKTPKTSRTEFSPILSEEIQILHNDSICLLQNNFNARLSSSEDEETAKEERDPEIKDILDFTNQFYQFYKKAKRNNKSTASKRIIQSPLSRFRMKPLSPSPSLRARLREKIETKPKFGRVHHRVRSKPKIITKSLQKTFKNKLNVVQRYVMNDTTGEEMKQRSFKKRKRNRTSNSKSGKSSSKPRIDLTKEVKPKEKEEKKDSVPNKTHKRRASILRNYSMQPRVSKYRRKMSTGLSCVETMQISKLYSFKGKTYTEI